MQQPAHPMSNQNITTEQIQKYLDENKQLILAILDNQNLGKLTECAQYQAQLQKNLLYLAAIADAQPQTRPQMMPHGAIPQGGQYMQQGPMFLPRAPLQFNPQQMQEPPQQQPLHHQPQVLPFPGHMGMRPGAVNGMHAMHAEPSHGSSADLRSVPSLLEFQHGSSTPGSSVDGRGSKQDGSSVASESAVASDDRRSSGTERSGDCEPKLPEKA